MISFLRHFCRQLGRLALLSAAVTGLFLLQLAISANPASATEDRFFTIGTGGVTGVYYPAGSAVCRYVNRGRKSHGLRCSVEATGGSIYNVRALRSDELDFGVTQSDWMHHAYKGTGIFTQEGAFSDLRMVMALHTEAFTILARRDSGIVTFDDLKDKRVNIGNPGSGSRATLQSLMEVKGWTKRDFALASELKSSEQSQALCDNKLDAVVFVVGHPSGTIKEATANCETRFVPVDTEMRKALIEQHPYYVEASIPADKYDNLETDLPTFGVQAVLVTSAKMDADIVSELVSAVTTNLDAFGRIHTAFSELTPEGLRRDLAVPFHDGVADMGSNVIAGQGE